MDEGILIRRIESRIREMQARGEPLRKDDDPEILKTRLDAYRRQTAPLTDHYRDKGLLRGVDGMAPIDEVTAAIDWIFQKPAAAKTSTKAANRQKSRKKSAKVVAKRGLKPKAPVKTAKKPAKAKKAAYKAAAKAVKKPAKKPVGKPAKTAARKVPKKTTKRR